MPKKLLFPFLISAVLTSPVNAQQTAVEQEASAFMSESAAKGSPAVTDIGESAGTDEAAASQKIVADTQEKSQEQVSGNSQPQNENAVLRLIKAVGSAYASGKVIETDEFADDWQAAQNPDVAFQERASENSEPQEENIILRLIKAVGSAYASGKLVETDELAQYEEKPEQALKPDITTSVIVPKPPETTAVLSVEQSAEKPAIAPPASAEPVTAVQITSVEKTDTGLPQITTAVSGKAVVPVVVGQKKPKEEPVVKPSDQQVGDIAGTKRPFPEIVTSTWQDHLSKDTPVAEITEKALAGDPEAQYWLGMACYLGQGVQKDDGKAFQWWQKSAEKGYPKAMHIMGVAYRRGIGVRKHAEKALDWFTKAAQQGRAIDQYIVADVYYEAKVNNIRDDALAVYWATHSARQGHPGALILLAQTKMEGRGVPPNIIHAYVLAQKAAEFDRDADVIVEEIEKVLPDEQQEIAKTVTLEDALEPTPLAALLIPKTSDEKTVQSSTSQADGTTAELPKTDNQPERTDND